MYLYQTKRYVCYTYCTVDPANKNNTNEDSLIRFEPDNNDTLPDKCDRGVQVIGNLPVIPIGDTRVGFDTVTNKIKYMRDINRFKMISLLEKEEEERDNEKRKIRIFTIESKSDNIDSIELDKSLMRMGVGKEWTKVERSRTKKEREYVPLTKNANEFITAADSFMDQKLMKSSSISKAHASNSVSPMSTFEGNENTTHDRVHRWVDSSASQVSTISNKTIRMEERLVYNLQFIRSRLAQCDAFLDPKRASAQLSKLAIETTAQDYFMQRMKEQGLAKRRLEDVTSGARRVPASTTVFIINDHREVTHVCETSFDTNVFTVMDQFHFIECDYNF